MPRMWMRAAMAGICAMGLGAGAVCAQQAAGYRFSVSFRGAQSADAIDGRLLLVLSTDPSESRECRSAIRFALK